MCSAIIIIYGVRTNEIAGPLDSHPRLLNTWSCTIGVLIPLAWLDNFINDFHFIILIFQLV